MDFNNAMKSGGSNLLGKKIIGGNLVQNQQQYQSIDFNSRKDSQTLNTDDKKVINVNQRHRYNKTIDTCESVSLTKFKNVKMRSKSPISIENLDQENLQSINLDIQNAKIP